MIGVIGVIVHGETKKIRMIMDYIICTIKLRVLCPIFGRKILGGTEHKKVGYIMMNITDGLYK